MKTMKTKWTKSRDYVPCCCRSSVVLFQRRGYSGGETPVGKEMLSRRVSRSLFLRRYPVLPATMFKATTISWV